jgi:hypothetical protein
MTHGHSPQWGRRTARPRGLCLVADACAGSGRAVPILWGSVAPGFHIVNLAHLQWSGARWLPANPPVPVKGITGDQQRPADRSLGQRPPPYRLMVSAGQDRLRCVAEPREVVCRSISRVAKLARPIPANPGSRGITAAAAWAAAVSPIHGSTTSWPACRARGGPPAVSPAGPRRPRRRRLAIGSLRRQRRTQQQKSSDNSRGKRI